MKNNILAIMEKLLKETDVDKKRYSIGEYEENAVCLLFNGERYEVFRCAKDNKYNCRRYYSAKEACVDMVCRLTKNDLEKRKLVLEKLDAVLH